MDCSPPGSSVHGIVHGIFQVRILECIAIPFSRGSSRPRDWTWVSCIVGRVFIVGASREAGLTVVPWTDRIPDLAVLPAHKTAWKSDSLRRKMFTAMTITLNTSHLGSTGEDTVSSIVLFSFSSIFFQKMESHNCWVCGFIFLFLCCYEIFKDSLWEGKKNSKKEPSVVENSRFFMW